MISRFMRFAACCLLLTLPAAAQTPLRIAAASDLQSVLPALTARFERETRHTVEVSFGSSGNFFAQLQNGAPFDLFFSADVHYPRQLESSRLTVPGTLVEHACAESRSQIPHTPRTDAPRLPPCSTNNCTTAFRASSCWARTSHRPRSSLNRATPTPG